VSDVVSCVTFGIAFLVVLQRSVNSSNASYSDVMRALLVKHVPPLPTENDALVNETCEADERKAEVREAETKPQRMVLDGGIRALKHRVASCAASIPPWGWLLGIGMSDSAASMAENYPAVSLTVVTQCLLRMAEPVLCYVLVLLIANSTTTRQDEHQQLHPPQPQRWWVLRLAHWRRTICAFSAVSLVVGGLNLHLMLGKNPASTHTKGEMSQIAFYCSSAVFGALHGTCTLKYSTVLEHGASAGGGVRWSPRRLSLAPVCFLVRLNCVIRHDLVDCAIFGDNSWNWAKSSAQSRRPGHEALHCPPRDAIRDGGSCVDECWLDAKLRWGHCRESCLSAAQFDDCVNALHQWLR